MPSPCLNSLRPIRSEGTWDARPQPPRIIGRPCRKVVGREVCGEGGRMEGGAELWIGRAWRTDLTKQESAQRH